LSQVTFGHATISHGVNAGVLGVSFGQNYNTLYPNIIDQLYLQNITTTRAFGVALSAESEPPDSGVVTFGGVDTKKFKGNLYTAPILPPSLLDATYHFRVQLDAVALNGKTYAGSQTQAIFDTGTSLSTLPQSVVSQIVSDLHGQFNSSVNLYFAPCGQSGTLSFTFGNMTIDINVSDFMLDTGQNQCILGVSPSTTGESILGDSFLRSVYTVFDIDTPAVHFAQYVNCGSNEQPIPGPNAISNFVGECTATTMATATTTATATATATAKKSGATGLTVPGLWLGPVLLLLA
jgi:hypothetical protein